MATAMPMLSSVNSRPVATVEEFEAALQDARDAGREAVLLRVQARGGQTQSIPVRFNN